MNVTFYTQNFDLISGQIALLFAMHEKDQEKALIQSSSLLQ